MCVLVLQYSCSDSPHHRHFIVTRVSFTACVMLIFIRMTEAYFSSVTTLHVMHSNYGLL